jgi:hypothetical protein
MDISGYFYKVYMEGELQNVVALNVYSAEAMHEYPPESPLCGV